MLDIGRSVKSIGLHAFDGCTELAEMVSLATTPPAITDLCAIEGIIVDKRFNGKTFNLQGIEVGKDYKGIVIQGGKKLLKR